ncbi:F420-dependent methylenetetrahydromethanopterin dehydrogenase [Candidatus Thorarchaeota archaeon]|nr:MAG: F420-dependent methylenetetrahydromethanopterin dehydrogenase [Candidatus Thorarchaeota archaeon]
MPFKLAIVKMGCIGSSPLLDFIFDERAECENLEVRVFASGAKMDTNSCRTLIDYVREYKPDLVLLASPNAGLEGPSLAREVLREIGVYVISISDAPSKKVWYAKDDGVKQAVHVFEKQGFIIVPPDSMIGARAEFLDPTEMVLFNSDILRVLANGGVIRAIQSLVGKVISDISNAIQPDLPKITLDAEVAIEYANYQNPYAKAKAYASLKIAESVSGVTSEACFKRKDSHEYIPLTASGHELMRAAAKLADEAREVEKTQDSVYRTPHGSDRRIKSKERLMDKPK